MAFFSEIAKRFGLLPELAKQTWQTAKSQNIERQLAEVQKPQLKPITTGGFFTDIAERFNLTKPQEFVKQKPAEELTPIQKAISEMTPKEKMIATGNFTKEIAQIFPKIAAKVGVSLYQAPTTIKTMGEEVPEPVKLPKPLQWITGEEKIGSYAKDIERRIDAGGDPLKSFLLTGAQVTWDVLIVSSLLKFGTDQVLKHIKVPDTSHYAAWQSLGQPQTVNQAHQTWKDLAKVLHPDKPTGSEAAMTQLNNAWNIVKMQGIPKAPPQPLQIVRDIAQALNTPVSELMKLKSAQPFLGVKGLLPSKVGYTPAQPYQPSRQPAFGLSIKEEPMKPIKPPIPPELQPLAQEARKYKSAKDYYKSLKTSQEFGFAGEKYIQIDLPIKDIQGRLVNYMEYRDITERGGLPTAGAREVKTPIKVTVENLGDLQNTRVDIVDGNQRLRQAIANGDETIPAKIFVKEQQLTDFYSQAMVSEGVPPTKHPPSLEKLGFKEKPTMITRKEDVLLRQRIRDEARGAKVGAVGARRLTREELITKFKSSQENVKQIRNDLIKYIDENLPAEAKGRLVKPLTMDNLTRKKAASIFSRVERMKETLTRKELVSEIKELSVPKGNLAVDYQKQITETIRGIDLVKPTEATLRKLKGLKDYIQKEGIPLNIQSKYVEKLNRLTKKSISELTTAELSELKDTLNQLQQLGKLKQDLKYKYNERERKVALDKLLASTKNIDPKVSGKQTKLDTYKVGTKKVYMDTLHTPRVADMIDGFKGYQGENAKLIKDLGNKETVAKENTRTIVNSALEEIQELGVKELTEEQQIRMMINIRYREGAYDQVKTLMTRYGYTEVPKITEQEAKVIDILKKNTNRHSDEVGAIYEEIENKPFHKLDEYILPIKYEREFNLIPSQTIEQGRFRTTQTFKGFTFERQKGVEKTPRTDILAVFEEAINEQQWYLNMQPALENIKYLVKSEEYLAKGGEMASNWWRNELDVVARRGWSATAKSNPMLRQSRLNLNQAILGYKVSSILMQPFAVFDAMAYAQSRYGTIAALKVLKEFSKAWIIPKYAKNIIAESPALQLRQAGELAIEETLKKVGRTKGLWDRLVRGGMSLLQKADVKTAAGVEKGLMNILEKHGVPNAKQEAEFLMNMVSGSNEVTYRPHILSSGEGARTWFTFQTFFLNRWGIVIHDLVKSGVIKGNIWQKLSALIGLGIFAAGSIAENEARKAIYETTTGKKLPDESLLKQVTMFLPEQIPYFGNLIEAADRGGDANPPVIRTVENVFKGGVSLIGGKETETKIKGGLRMTEAGLTLGVGVPGTAQFFDLLEKIFLGEKEKVGIGGELPQLPKLPSLLKLPTLPKL